MDALKNLFTMDNILWVCNFLAKPLLVLLVGKIVISIFVKLTHKVLDKSHLDSGIKSFLKSAVRISLWFIAIIIAADMLGLNTSSLVTLLGVISLALSLSLQNLMTNVFSGITLLLSKPFSVDDYVEIAGVGGTVQSISLMRTTLITPDKKVELLPNSDVCAGRITNYSLEPIRRIEIKVSASYDDSTEKVREAILEVLLNDKRVKRGEDVLPTVRLYSYNANDIEYIVRAWVNNKEYWDVYYDALEGIRESFAKHNIQFSYPHVVLHNAE